MSLEHLDTSESKKESARGMIGACQKGTSLKGLLIAKPRDNLNKKINDGSNGLITHRQ